jgi:hypothetical protein
MFEDFVEPPKTKKLSELLAASWVFPTDYPVVDNNHKFDQARATLKASIAYMVTEYYKDHRICSFVEAEFTQRLSARLYKTMAQHQYWIDQFLGLIEDNQFFYNEEWNDGGSQTTESSTDTNNNTSKSMDTPQNTIADINNYLTAAEVNNGGATGERESAYTTDLHVKRSTLGDITVQFRNFANFPQFSDTIIEAVRPCFISYYGDEDIDFNGAA